MDLSVQNTLEPKKGCFLLAEPFLQEEHFHRSVIFLCEHNEEGSFGFVLNRFIEVVPSELAKQFPSKELKICLGGPVDENNLFYIHKSKELIDNCHEISNGLCIGGDFEQVKELMNQDILKEDQIIFFLGYSGWTQKQLEEEIEAKSWLVAEIKDPTKHLFSKKRDLWKTLMSEQGKRHEIMSKFPDNHLWN
jgi:putative transcriptional regulator